MKKNILNVSAVGSFTNTEKNNLQYLENPSPSIKKMPEWYRKTDLLIGGKDTPSIGEIPKPALKSCIPFFDALSHGYTIETWCDIKISYTKEYSLLSEEEQDYPNFYWTMDPQPIEIRDINIMNNFPVPEYFSKTPYVWKQPWAIKTPPGYSLLYTHPLNRLDLPFFTLSGISDSDLFYSAGNLPFYLKKGFTGIIPAGTPIAQIIPIKRESWKVSSDVDLHDKSNKLGAKARSVIRGFYKQNIWQRKDFT